VQRDALTKDWLLGVGRPFTQGDWDAAKKQALQTLTARTYPRAQVARSLADIDPAQHSAHLSITLDSGPPVTLGELHIQGSQRYDEDMTRRLVRLAGVRSGEPYDEARLQAAQQRLVDSGYYASAFVAVDEEGPPQAATVQVRVREAQRQKLVLGMGASTDNGPRLSLEHTHLLVPGLHWRADTALKLEQDARSLGTQLRSPVDDQGWHWITGAQWARQDDGARTTFSQQWRAGLAQEGESLDRSLFAQYDQSRVVDPALPTENASAISANYAWTRRRFDDNTFPRRGHGLAVELGAGMTLSQEQRPYLRAKARWLGYWPLGEEGTRPSRLAVRLEGGAVWARASTPVPATQRFLAGGDQSVRGYGPREIGVPLTSGGVEAGRLLAVASVEWQRPLWIDGVRSPWELAVFADAGAVADTVRELSPVLGIGAGVRYRSPVGPLQVDLAYGVDKKQLRLHLSVGFTF
jgi:translocation and assembly module TamA